MSDEIHERALNEEPPLITVEDEAPVDEGKGICTWCRQPVGAQHHRECVRWKRKVTIKATVTYDIEVPMSWTPYMIEFHRNDSSYCLGNMVDELEALGCLCPFTEVVYVGEAEARENDSR